MKSSQLEIEETEKSLKDAVELKLHLQKVMNQKES
jgi:hypothetical protein